MEGEQVNVRLGKFLVGGLALVSATTCLAAPPTPPKAAAPGLGDASWSMLYMDDQFAIYFVASGIKKTGATASGWFTTVYLEPQSYPSANLSGVSFIQGRDLADCSKRLLKSPDLAAYDGDGKLLLAGPDPNASWDKVEAGTAGERKFNILCGKPQALESKAPISGNHSSIMMHYASAMMEAAHDALMKKSQQPH